MPHTKLNAIGPLVRRERDSKGMSQGELARELQKIGWDLERSGVGKIEAQLVRVRDIELPYLATALNVTIAELIPPQLLPGKDVHARVQKLLSPMNKVPEPLDPYKRAKKDFCSDQEIGHT